MHKRQTSYDKLCQRETLLAAFNQVRRKKGAPGYDQVTLAQYEQTLEAHLDDLSQRLREGCYYPSPLRKVALPKASGGTRSIGILNIDDRIVQRALLDILEPRLEARFLDCSHGFRPGRSPATAVQAVLNYRAAGDKYVVDADISACFDSLDHTILLGLLQQIEPDKRLLNLIRMLLETGQCLAKDAKSSPSLYDRATGYLVNSVNGALSDLLVERGMGYGYHAYSAPDLYEPTETDATDLQQQARKEALKRLGKDAALLALTYAARVRKIVSPTTLAITGVMVAASAAYPIAERAWRNRYGPRLMGALQGGALSPLLANLYLHQFDQAITKAGFHLIRYADDFVVCCPDQKSAEAALVLVNRQLGELRLQLNPQKTRISRFDEGVEFLGYRFEQFHCTAKPIAEKNSLPVLQALQTAQAKVAPVAARAAQQTKNGLSRVAELLKRKKGIE